MTRNELRAIRTEIGWSPPEAAERLGVTPRTYRYYESGFTSSGRAASSVPRAIAIAMLALRYTHRHPGSDLSAALLQEQLDA